MFAGPFDESIIKRAMEKGLVSIAVHNIRDYAAGRHRITDDYPYGGGRGMVMKPEPIFEAVEALVSSGGGGSAPRIILLSPQGRLFTQEVAQELAACERLILICGHYEWVDERVREHLATDEISIGDYILTGGEIAAMALIDAVCRLVPGVLPPEAPAQDSLAEGLLEYPQYTRPAEFRGWKVPEVLLSGNHGQIARWRRQQSLRRTFERRPDLLAKAKLTEEDRAFVRSLGADI